MFIIAWLVLGIIGTGLMLAYWQGKYPKIAKEDYRKDITWCYGLSVFGPLYLLVSLVLLWVWDDYHGKPAFRLW